MSQRTYNYSDEDDVETALSFLNNVRVKNKMVQDIEALARNYLYEFNDSTTLNNMNAALNKYVNDWVQNRTLSYGSVEVEAGSTIEEVNVTLNITFTGTIEVITIDIVIE
jgi:hypothetical protein